MIHSRNQNSFLAVATLGVYLGLILAGATPSVLAQAATAKQFSVKDEAGRTDDVDKNPSDVDDLEQDVQTVERFTIAEGIVEFASDLRKLERIGKVKISSDLNFSYKLWSEQLQDSNSISRSQNADIDNPWLKTAVIQLLANAAKDDALDLISDWLPNCAGKVCRESSVEITSNASEFVIKLGISKANPAKAKAAAERFSKIFQIKTTELQVLPKLSIYENTTSTAENNQVLIVTRLPRGSLDTLLSSNAK